MSDNEKLLPCPFCGGEARIRHMYVAGEPSHSMAECTKCHVKTDFYVYQFGERNVIDVWNSRYWSNEIMLMGDRLYFEGLGTFERVKDER